MVVPKSAIFGVAGKTKDFVIIENISPGVSLYAVVSGHDGTEIN